MPGEWVTIEDLRGPEPDPVELTVRPIGGGDIEVDEPDDTDDDNGTAAD